MKAQTHSLKFLMLFAVLLLAVGTLCAQNAPVPGQEYPSQSPSAQPSTPPSQQPDTQAPPPSQAPDQTGAGQGSAPDAQAQSPAGTQTFTGTVVKQGDKYVLQDAASGKSFDIDHQDQVKQFEGKRVRVHGTLDAGSNMIHIQ